MGQITRTNFGICKTVTLGNAEILALPTNSPLVLIPAIPGKAALVDGISIVFRWFADLTNVDDDTEAMPLQYSSGGPLNLGTVGKNGIFDAGSSQICGGFNEWGLGATPLPLADISGDVELVVTNGSAGDFTGGHLNNRLIIQVFYVVVPA